MTRSLKGKKKEKASHVDPQSGLGFQKLFRVKNRLPWFVKNRENLKNQSIFGINFGFQFTFTGNRYD
jgi:hypothetical protein